MALPLCLSRGVPADYTIRADKQKPSAQLPAILLTEYKESVKMLTVKPFSGLPSQPTFLRVRLFLSTTAHFQVRDTDADPWLSPHSQQQRMSE
jgi:hypothetical protein